jgi:hypothetical protein
MTYAARGGSPAASSTRRTNFGPRKSGRPTSACLRRWGTPPQRRKGGVISTGWHRTSPLAWGIGRQQAQFFLTSAPTATGAQAIAAAPGLANWRGPGQRNRGSRLFITGHLRKPFDIPLSPVCQGVLRPGQATGGPWRGLKPDKCPAIDGQKEAGGWPGHRIIEATGGLKDGPVLARIESRGLHGRTIGQRIGPKPISTSVLTTPKVCGARSDPLCFWGMMTAIENTK